MVKPKVMRAHRCGENVILQGGRGMKVSFYIGARFA